MLLRLSRLSSKPRFYSNIEPYRYRHFRIFIDGFSFFGKWRSSNVWCRER